MVLQWFWTVAGQHVFILETQQLAQIHDKIPAQPICGPLSEASGRRLFLNSCICQQMARYVCVCVCVCVCVSRGVANVHMPTVTHMHQTCTEIEVRLVGATKSPGPPALIQFHKPMY